MKTASENTLTENVISTNGRTGTAVRAKSWPKTSLSVLVVRLPAKVTDDRKRNFKPTTAEQFEPYSI